MLVRFKYPGTQYLHKPNIGYKFGYYRPYLGHKETFSNIKKSLKEKFSSIYFIDGFDHYFKFKNQEDEAHFLLLILPFNESYNGWSRLVDI